MQRLSEDRGAVAVVVALLLIPLIGFAAIAIDVASMWSVRQQLQTGADAAAMAVAQDCARNECGVPGQTAQSLAVANFGNGEVTATVTEPAPTPSSGKVTVRTSASQDHLFAPILGYDQSSLSASATVSWGYPTGGTAVLPLTFSWCEFAAQTGGGLPSGTETHTIRFTKSSGTTCTGPSNNVVPGGFGWLSVNSGTCNTISGIDYTMWTSTGVSTPTGCTVEDFAALQGRVALVPLFDQEGVDGNGANAWYRIYGYAAFMITGYYFGGQYVWNAGECKGEDRCLRGYFTEFVDLSNAFTYDIGAPKLGAAVVSLTS